ncbi:squalene/phytoene synthase family protein [Streptomyces sp. XD-27]|uniref:squalene/phytoene synthase family protein n=1 Tax=Streptomyces sp. XD-27 TaxID=3062779 RepID=UPI0026F47C96|nr:squalene/phytoene synthase family protein [Streptomyces sp. XD-27]WKX72692.1 squalene/phytoene synthase family protein [Streptomyces sp. XD-27]
MTRVPYVPIRSIPSWLRLPGVIAPWNHALDTAGLRDDRTRDDYTQVARQLARRHPAEYACVRLLLPARWQPHLFALALFGTHGDSLVDAPVHQRDHGQFRLWADRVRSGLATGRAHEPYLRAFLHTMAARGIPHDDVHTYLAAQAEQLCCTGYATEQDYYDYVDHAGLPVIRLMLAVCHPGGGDMPGPGPWARLAVDAVQRVDDLADLATDLRAGKLTLPEVDLARFGVTRRDLESGRDTPAVRALLAHACQRARTAVTAADEALAHATPEGQLLLRPPLAAVQLLMDTVESRGTALTRAPVTIPTSRPSATRLIDDTLGIVHARLRVAAGTAPTG